MLSNLQYLVMRCTAFSKTQLTPPLTLGLAVAINRSPCLQEFGLAAMESNV